MKLLYVFTFLIALVCGEKTNEKKLSCTLKPETITQDWMDIKNTCAEKLQRQVNEEVKAAITYLAMGAHFAQDNINRPGFSKFFFEAANEEREHSIKIIEYLLMRGKLTSDVDKLLKFPLKPHSETWENGLDALKKALEVEANVTRSIRNIIETCENSNSKHKNGNDYHVVDYLTEDFLDEQYKGQRDLAGKITTLGKMMATQGPLGEFLFDKKLLNGEL